MQRRFETQALARGEVVQEGDVGDVLVAQCVDIGLAWQIPSQSPVHVLHRALLPTGVSVAEGVRWVYCVMVQGLL